MLLHFQKTPIKFDKNIYLIFNYKNLRSVNLLSIFQFNLGNRNEITILGLMK